MRTVIAVLTVEDDRAVAADLGTLDYVAEELKRVRSSGIYCGDMKLLDYDDPCDAKAIELAERLFEEE